MCPLRLNDQALKKVFEGKMAAPSQDDEEEEFIERNETKRNEMKRGKEQGSEREFAKLSRVMNKEPDLHSSLALWLIQLVCFGSPKSCR